MQYLAWLREKQILDSNSMKSEGMRIGAEKKVIEIVRNMLKEDIDIEVIMRVSRLTKEEIEKIKQEMDKENNI